MKMVKYKSPFHAIYDEETADSLLFKMEKMLSIEKRIIEKGWNVGLAAEKLGLSKARILDLIASKANGFTVEEINEIYMNLSEK